MHTCMSVEGMCLWLQVLLEALQWTFAEVPELSDMSAGDQT